MDNNLAEHRVREERRLTSIEASVQSLDEKVGILQKEISGLVSAWKAASWLVGLIKWAGAVATAILAMLAIIKGAK